MAQDVKHSVRRRQRGYTRVSSKNQVTLPVDALEQAGLKVGDRLRVEVNGPGEVVLRRTDDALDQYAGTLTGVWPQGALDELRREWD